jgi:hypothetical protein
LKKNCSAYFIYVYSSKWYFEKFFKTSDVHAWTMLWKNTDQRACRYWYWRNMNLYYNGLCRVSASERVTENRWSRSTGSKIINYRFLTFGLGTLVNNSSQACSHNEMLQSGKNTRKESSRYRQSKVFYKVLWTMRNVVSMSRMVARLTMSPKYRYVEKHAVPSTIAARLY